MYCIGGVPACAACDSNTLAGELLELLRGLLNGASRWRNMCLSRSGRAGA